MTVMKTDFELSLCCPDEPSMNYSFKLRSVVRWRIANALTTQYLSSAQHFHEIRDRVIELVVCQNVLHEPGVAAEVEHGAVGDVHGRRFELCGEASPIPIDFDFLGPCATESLLRCQHHVTAALRIESDQAHRAYIECDAVAAGEDEIHSAALTGHRSATLHGRGCVHQRQLRLQNPVERGQQLIDLRVMVDAVLIVRNAAPLVLQRPGEICESVRLENRKSDESIAFKHWRPESDGADRIAMHGREWLLGEIYQLDVEPLCHFHVTRGLEGLPCGLAHVVGFHDVDLSCPSAQHFTRRGSNLYAGVGDIDDFRHGRAHVGFEHHGGAARHPRLPLTPLETLLDG